MKVTLVIPAYNEAPVIGATLRSVDDVFQERLTPHGITWEILVADNASTDGTSRVVRDTALPSVQHLLLREKGKGRAVRAGFQQSDADIYAFTDADLSVPPEEIALALLSVYHGHARLVIGSRNTVREFCTFNLGTTQDEGITSLGDDNWIMAYVHLAHDCRVGNRTIFANNAQLAGHVHVGDWAILGGYTSVHQFVHIGAHAMTGMGSALVQDLPPFIMANGNTAQVHGFNIEGLRRRGFTQDRLTAVKRMYKALYRQSLTLEQAKAAIAAIAQELPEAAADVALMSGFLEASTRGIVR
jgi:UDP-N-acetylglucosamine acyltransferase